VRLTDSVGTVMATRSLETEHLIESFDLRSIPEGLYRIDEIGGGNIVGGSQIYVSHELRGVGVWGIVSINIDHLFYIAPPVLSLEFVARQEPLKYFVVARNFTASEFDQLGVSDNGFNEENRAMLTFEKLLPADFTGSDISPSLLGDSTCRIVMFRSQLPVARRERGLRKIQLNRNGDVLVEHLPQPGADRPQAHLIVHLSKP
jgi:hypothetical protein